MIPLIYVGIISFLSSFTVSHFTTRELLRYKYEQEMYETFIEPKKDSLVRFNKVIKVRTIPSVKDLSSNTLSSLWYQSNDYYKFHLEYSLAEKYNSI